MESLATKIMAFTKVSSFVRIERCTSTGGTVDAIIEIPLCLISRDSTVYSSI